MFISARKQLTDGDQEGALKQAEAAWEALPEPKFSWDVSKSYTHALARLYRDCRRFDQAIALMQRLFDSGTVRDYQDGPRFVMGTIYFEAGCRDEARKWLSEANEISRGRCFAGEPPKYQALIKG